MGPSTPTLEEPLAGFIRQWITSIWTLETLLLVERDRRRGWTTEQLTTELRSSRAAIVDAVERLRQAGLVGSTGAIHTYQPISTGHEQLVSLLCAAYARTPVAVIKAILATPDAKLKNFTDAFRLKKD